MKKTANRKPGDKVALQVRMSEGLRVKLKRAAIRERRSLNSEIVHRLAKQCFPAS